MSAELNTIPELMHAIRAIQPGCNVGVELREAEGYAAVTVIGMPDDLFPGNEAVSIGSYPNCSAGLGGWLNVCRYADADFIAALRTALDIISERMAVTR